MGSFLVLSCSKDSKPLVFSEVNILKEAATTIAVNIPKANGNSEAAQKINQTLNNFVSEALHLDAAEDKKETLAESMQSFNNSYTNFSKLITQELQGELPIWEAIIDGEVVYHTANLICIAMNSSIHTGAANSKMRIRFFNFNPKTGTLLTTSDLINNITDFTVLAQKYYHKEVVSTFIESDFFLNDNRFNLPENLGFSEEGVILLFTNFNAPGFEDEMLEFVIPYEVSNDYLKI